MNLDNLSEVSGDSILNRVCKLWNTLVVKEYCKREEKAVFYSLYWKIQGNTYSKTQLASSHDVVKECAFYCNLKTNSKLLKLKLSHYRRETKCYLTYAFKSLQTEQHMI